MVITKNKQNALEARLPAIKCIKGVQSNQSSEMTVIDTEEVWTPGMIMPLHRWSNAGTTHKSCKQRVDFAVSESAVEAVTTAAEMQSSDGKR